MVDDAARGATSGALSRALNAAGPADPVAPVEPARAADSEPTPEPRFATDRATARYYERRAPEYDDWYLGQGLFARSERPGWSADVERLQAVLAALTPATTVDIACGTGFLTRFLPGAVTGIDQSAAMAAIARTRVAGARVAVGDALHLPFRGGAFERAFVGSFYGHLSDVERASFLAECRRVAGHLVVVDAAARSGIPRAGWQERVLLDGSRHRVFKRYFSAESLAAELAGETIFAGRYFVAVSVDLHPEAKTQ